MQTDAGMSNNDEMRVLRFINENYSGPVPLSRLEEVRRCDNEFVQWTWGLEKMAAPGGGGSAFADADRLLTILLWANHDHRTLANEEVVVTLGGDGRNQNKRQETILTFTVGRDVQTVAIGAHSEKVDELVPTFERIMPSLDKAHKGELEVVEFMRAVTKKVDDHPRHLAKWLEEHQRPSVARAVSNFRQYEADFAAACASAAAGDEEVPAFITPRVRVRSAGDNKWQAATQGLTGASSTYPCIHCTVTDQDQHLFQDGPTVWRPTNAPHNARDLINHREKQPNQKA